MLASHETSINSSTRSIEAESVVDGEGSSRDGWCTTLGEDDEKEDGGNEGEEDGKKYDFIFVDEGEKRVRNLS